MSDLCLPFKCLRGINKPVQSLPCPATYCTSMIDAVSLHCLQGQVAIWGPGLLFATLNTRCCGQINPKAQQQHSSFQRLADRRPVILQPNSAQSEPNPETLRRTRPSGPGPARSPGCCVALAARNQAVQTGSPLRYSRRPPSARAAPSRHRAADAASSKPSPRRPSRRKRPRRPLKTAASRPTPGGSTVRAQDDPGGWLRRPLKS